MDRKVAKLTGIQVFNFLSGRQALESACKPAMTGFSAASAVRGFFLRLEDRGGLPRFGDVALLRLQRQITLAPADDPLAQLHRVEAGFGEGGGRHRGAVAAAAVDDHRPVFVDLLGALGQLRQRHVLGAGDVAGIPLVIGSDVDQLSALLDHLAGLLARDLPGLPMRCICHQSTSVPSIKNATRTWARYSSRFSPRMPVETMSTARMLRSEPWACCSACLAASSVDVLELPTSSMIFTTAMRILLVGPRSSPWRRPPPGKPPAARRASPAPPPPGRSRTQPRTARSRRRRPRPRSPERSSVPRAKPSSGEP